MTRVLSNAHRVEIVAAPTTYLETQAGLTAPGTWRDVGAGMGGLNWSILNENLGGETVCAYGGKAAYSATLNVIRWVGNGAANNSGLNDEKPIEYNITTNTWSRPADRPHPGFFGGHGFDHMFTDTDTGMIFSKCYGTWDGSGRFAGWNGSTWNGNIITGMATSGMGLGEYIHGIDYDAFRGGVWVFEDSSGARFWRKSDNTWPRTIGVYEFPISTYFSGWTGLGYHWSALFNHANNYMWFIAANNSPNHWRLSPTNVVTAGATPPWSTIGGHGANGKLHCFDYRSGKFLVVAVPERQAYLYDIAANSFTRVADLPTGFVGDSGDAVNGTYVGLPAPYNVVLVLYYAGVGNNPKCYLYKSP